ncbi:MAG TPA: hypothetical protein VFX64_06805 [Candidatus Nitrosotalea sp.]|nr:hypothetical protein [Candidatus Nitrosotalea sp.]
MSQVSEIIPEKPTWVLVSSIHDNTNANDFVKITPQVVQLVDERQSEGRFVWSGPLSDNKTGIAIFQGTKDEANGFLTRYNKICSGILNAYMYQWDAMPLLSLFEDKVQA